MASGDARADVDAAGASGSPVDALRRVQAYFERLRAEDLDRLGEIYAPQAWFKDPFNEVQGVARIRPIFDAMFRELEAPRFVVDAAFGSGRQGFLAWRMMFERGGRPETIRGCTHLEFDDELRVLRHRDYWDTAEELYEKIGVLRPLMRWLRRRLSASGGSGALH
jgi:steroid Delta-isomerase